jgi:enterochelin esterase family protein
MPDVNFGVHEDKPSHHTLWNNVINYPRLCHDHDIEKALVELIHMTDTTYRVSDERYIAGLSDGARIAANTANMLPGYFVAIGMFSPVVHKKQMPQDNIAVYVYTGKKDMFHANAKRFYRRLEKKQTTRVYMETTGGHTWRNWRIYLSDFLRHLHQ